MNNKIIYLKNAINNPVKKVMMSPIKIINNTERKPMLENLKFLQTNRIIQNQNIKMIDSKEIGFCDEKLKEEEYEEIGEVNFIKKKKIICR